MIAHGHMIFIGNSENAISLKIVKATIEGELKKEKQRLQIMLDDWIDLIHKARLQYYCLNFIPNEQIGLFVRFVENPDPDTFSPIEYTLKSFRSRIKLQELKRLLDRVACRRATLLIAASETFILPPVFKSETENQLFRKFEIIQSVLDEFS